MFPNYLPKTLHLEMCRRLLQICDRTCSPCRWFESWTPSGRTKVWTSSKIFVSCHGAMFPEAIIILNDIVNSSLTKHRYLEGVCIKVVTLKYCYVNDSTTGVSKAAVCVILSVHIKEPLLLIGKSSPWGDSKFVLAIFVALYHMSDAI